MIRFVLDSRIEALMVIDVWEHAYYLSSRCARDWVKSWWNVVNWG
jgi:superoxide dismutase